MPEAQGVPGSHIKAHKSQIELRQHESPGTFLPLILFFILEVRQKSSLAMK